MFSPALNWFNNRTAHPKDDRLKNNATFSQFVTGQICCNGANKSIINSIDTFIDKIIGLKINRLQWHTCLRQTQKIKPILAL
jgi:hypothetical protein